MKPPNCDGRYPHYLMRMNGSSGPSRILCVDAIGELSRQGGSGVELVERLVSWDCEELIRSDNVLRIHASHGSRDSGGFWQMIADHCTHVGVTWIVSYRCCRVWALLDMWGRLESGAIRVSGGDYRSIASHDSHGTSSSPGLMIAEDPPCVVQLRIGTNPGSIMWVDCRNWGIELDDNIPNGIMTAVNIAGIVMRIEGYSSEHKLCSLAATAASTAYRSWRTNHLTHGVHCHVNPTALQFEREGHLGGRCECFRIGRIPEVAYHFDIRSCYGWIMQRYPLPVRLLDCWPSNPPTRLHDSGSAICTIAKVTLRTDEPAYPVRRDADTIWPVGTYTTILCGPELLDAIEHNRILKWHSAAEYKCELALRSFALSVYAIRDDATNNGDKAMSSWAKYVLNAIVGKASQKLKRWEVVVGARAPEPWGEWTYLSQSGEMERWRAMAGVVQREVQGGYTPDAVPSISAWICSYGRMRLLEAIRVAGWDQTYYCDTDSVITSEIGAERLYAAGLAEDGKLGLLELRGVHSDCEIRGIKYYLEGSEVKCSGFNRGISVRSADGFGEWVIPHGSAGAKLHAPQGRKRKLIRWPKAAPYRHGVVLSDGKVLPHRMEE